MAEVLCISDNDQDNVVIVNLSAMTVERTVAVGRRPYPVDAIGRGWVLVSTRGLQSIQPVEVSTGDTRDPIALSHTPRSATLHPDGTRVLVGGGDLALTTILDAGSLTAACIVGAGTQDERRDFGGGLACGHPAWGPDDTILHLDRIARRLELYDTDGERRDSVNLPSSAHHVAHVDGGYLALCEGNPKSRIKPSVLRFEVKDHRLSVIAHAFLPIPAMHVSRSGGHHLTYDGDRNMAYVGTNDGRLFTLCAGSLRMINVVDAGPGCGHVTICGRLAVATNHTGAFMTVLDLDLGRVVGSVDVSSAARRQKKTQGHTSKWFATEGRLVTTAAQDGEVLEIDPATRAVTRRVVVPGGYLIQGCFVSQNGSR